MGYHGAPIAEASKCAGAPGGRVVSLSNHRIIGGDEPKTLAKTSSTPNFDALMGGE